MKAAENERAVLELLRALVKAWRTAMLAGSAPIVNTMRRAALEPKVGHLVCETSALYRKDFDWSHIGFLLEITRTPEDGEMYVIEAWDGQRRRWRNAEFMRIPSSWQEVSQMQGFYAAQRAGGEVDEPPRMV